MFTQQIEQLTSCKNQLDDCFDDFADTARRLGDSSLNEVSETGKMSQILISISRDKRYHSVNIRWARVYYRIVDGKRGVAVRPLPKGRTRHQYADSTFSYLPEETRAMALKYEQPLAMIRQATKQNRALSKNVVAKLKEFKKLQATIETFIEQNAKTN